MARPLRLEFPGAMYHVIARGNERKSIYRDDEDRQRYLDRLAFYREKFSFQLLAYCLMDNHVHLAIETGKAPLSRIMAGLQSSYTQYFNWRHARVGHLFQGRYKAFLVEEDPYGLALIRYIHENPVRAKAVERAEDYAWSSDRYYRRGKGPEWLDLDRMLRMLGTRRSAAVREYRRLMRDAVAEPYEETATWGQVIKGDEAFAQRVLQRVGEPAAIRKALAIEGVAREVGLSERLTVAAMRSASRARAESRGCLLTALVARDVGGISIAKTARYFGRDASGMVRGVAKLEEAIGRDAKLRRRIEALHTAVRTQNNAKT
jgi:putative transposase